MVANDDVTLRLREPDGDLSGRGSLQCTEEVSYADQDYSQNLQESSIDESWTKWRGKVRTVLTDSDELASSESVDINNSIRVKIEPWTVDDHEAGPQVNPLPRNFIRVILDGN
ncbi:hypothetical protein QAD02_002413 [Eretmocerus hayati]|uniref:Uncharacterized protein n=1 Tax=Eretmocerus hayati TaxID=131215 RepID=A0ACC2NIT5_9HYME|nr:hypothetical protein QAD02_002413 [Eretmocerus hayati]